MNSPCKKGRQVHEKDCFRRADHGGNHGGHRNRPIGTACHMLPEGLSLSVRSPHMLMRRKSSPLWLEADRIRLERFADVQGLAFAVNEGSVAQIP